MLVDIGRQKQAWEIRLCEILGKVFNLLYFARCYYILLNAGVRDLWNA